mmetsp:Transcript_37826/g.112948  ORF Transcript_37826/g.112948 Transcript_37826/m.112948 type:complete len:324 (+) Transcript_37826:103-1074(+)
MAASKMRGVCCCNRRQGEGLEVKADAGPEREEPPLVQLSAHEFSRRGQYQWTAAVRGSDAQRPSATFDAQGLRLLPPGPAGAGAEPVAVLAWQDVSGVWATLRAKEGCSLSFEVYLETWGGEVDYAFLRGPINEVSGRFLEFLETTKAGKLKEGRAPRFSMSRWAVGLYRRGISSNRLRVVLGWVSIVVELIFAICFLSQVERIMASREGRLLKELSEISRSLGSFGGVGTVVVLIQHLAIFLFVLRSIFSTLSAAVGSLQTFHRATKKAHKSLGKLSSTTRPPGAASRMSMPAGGTEGPQGGRGTNGGMGEGDGLRQRRGAE